MEGALFLSRECLALPARSSGSFGWSAPLFQLALPALSKRCFKRAQSERGSKDKRPEKQKREREAKKGRKIFSPTPCSFSSFAQKKITSPFPKTGANAQPQGIQIAPVGRAEMSTGALSQPQGNVVSPVGSMEMSVGRDVTPGGSFMMNSMAAHGHSGHEGGGADEHAGHDMASMEHGGSGSAGSEHAGHDMGSRRRGLLSQGGDGEETKGDSGTGKILLSDDPLDLSNEMPTDYRNWASLLSQVLLAKEGGEGGQSGEESSRALAALDGLTLATRARLARAAAGDAEPLLPRFHLADPIFASSDHSGHGSSSDHSGHSMGEGKSMLSGVHAMSSFINYAPCVLGVRRSFFLVSFFFRGGGGGGGVSVAGKF